MRASSRKRDFAIGYISSPPTHRHRGLENRFRRSLNFISPNNNTASKVAQIVGEGQFSRTSLCAPPATLSRSSSESSPTAARLPEKRLQDCRRSPPLTYRKEDCQVLQGPRQKDLYDQKVGPRRILQAESFPPLTLSRSSSESSPTGLGDMTR